LRQGAGEFGDSGFICNADESSSELRHLLQDNRVES
jgi:hypothetical protein